MKHCLWCHTEILQQMYWKAFITGMGNTSLCGECMKQLEPIYAQTCTRCFKQSTKPICNDCHKWRLFFNGEDPLVKNISSFIYNDFLKEVIAKWKYRGDYVLIDMFTPMIKKTLQTYLKELMADSVVVPIPLSKERLQVRGFNQSAAIATRMLRNDDQMKEILKRTHGEKQSKKSRMQRIFGKNPFNLTETVTKPVILVDDIYTTGTTVRHAATLLKQNGCPAIYSYTLIRG